MVGLSFFLARRNTLKTFSLTPIAGLFSLPELVEDGVNGRIFESSQELCEQLWSLLHKLPESGQCGPHSYGDLASYSRSLKGRTRWQENWKKHALPALVEVTSI